MSLNAARMVESAEEFLASGQAAHTSCLISDIRMPGMSGIEMHERLRAQGHAPATIFTSAYPTPALQAKAASNGALVLPQKPYQATAMTHWHSLAPGRVRKSLADHRPRAEVLTRDGAGTVSAVCPASPKWMIFTTVPGAATRWVMALNPETPGHPDGWIARAHFICPLTIICITWTTPGSGKARIAKCLANRLVFGEAAGRTSFVFSTPEQRQDNARTDNANAHCVEPPVLRRRVIRSGRACLLRQRMGA
ncbi:response regulator [Paraburkholderia fungorum]|uniref:response regulator n=1 Tax=Paraburkholderia fungorum TaxID=134537 RepID=UPI0038B6C2CA